MGHRPAISRPSQPTTSPCRPSSSSSSRRAASSPLPSHAFSLPCFADAPASSSPRLPLHGALPLWPLPLPSALPSWRATCGHDLEAQIELRAGKIERHGHHEVILDGFTPPMIHFSNDPFCSPNLIPLVFFTIHWFDCSPSV